MVPQQVSFVERPSLSQMVPYRRFHCIATVFPCVSCTIRFAEQTPRIQHVPVSMMNLSLQRMPFPPTAYNRFLLILGFVLGLLVVMSFLYTAATITKVTKFICTNSFSLKLSSSLKFSFIEQLLGVHGGLVGRLILSRSINVMC